MGNQDRNQFDQDQSKSNDNINTKDFLIGALIGGIVGAATALFLAPKSGKELISDLNEQASALKEKTGQIRENAMTKGNELANAAKEKTTTLSQTVSQQSVELVNKVKNLKPNEGGQIDEDGAAAVADELEAEEITDSSNTDEEKIQLKLEETKRAFDETEDKYNH